MANKTRKGKMDLLGGPKTHMQTYMISWPWQTILNLTGHLGKQCSGLQRQTRGTQRQEGASISALEMTPERYNPRQYWLHPNIEISKDTLERKLVIINELDIEKGSASEGDPAPFFKR